MKGFVRHRTRAGPFVLVPVERLAGRLKPLTTFDLPLDKVAKAGRGISSHTPRFSLVETKSNSLRILLNYRSNVLVSSTVRGVVGRRATRLCFQVSSGGSAPVDLTYTWVIAAHSGCSPSRSIMAASSSAPVSFFLAFSLIQTRWRKEL